MQIYSGVRQELPAGLWERLGHYRHQVFVRQLGWNLPPVAGGLPAHESDQFDRADTHYVVAVKECNNAIVGCARLLPTLEPYLLSDVFPQLLGEQPPPSRNDIWELSRFAAMDPAAWAEQGQPPGQISSPHALALLSAVKKVAAQQGARELITVSPVAIGRLLRHNGIAASRAGPVCRVEGEVLCAYRFNTTRVARVTEHHELAL